MAPSTIKVEIKRQSNPDAPATTEKFEIPYRPGMNITSLLGEIALNPVDVSGKPTTPITYDSNCLEEICGSCAMLINGKATMACSALVDKLTGPNKDQTITLAPLSKFPVVRDLAVDRSVLFENLKKVKAWVPIDGSYDLGPGPRQAPQIQEQRYPQRRHRLRRRRHHRPGQALQHGPQRLRPQRRTPPSPRRRRRHPGMRLRAKLRPGLPQTASPHRSHQRHGPRRLRATSQRPLRAMILNRDAIKRRDELDSRNQLAAQSFVVRNK
jgi:hypothetical protein